MNNPLEQNNCICVPVTIEQIKANLDKVISICIDGSITFGNNTRNFSTTENPIAYTNIRYICPNMISINGEYYKEHKDEIDELIIYIAKNTKLSNIRFLSKDLINDSLIDALSQNENIETIRLGDDTQEDGILLSNKYYEILKRNKNIETIYTYGVEDELKDNFDSIIEYNVSRKLFCEYTYSSLQKKEIYIKTSLSDEELENLKYISKDCKITIKYEDIENIKILLVKLKENDLLKNTFLEIPEYLKASINQFLFDNYDYLSELMIICGLDIISYASYVEYEKYLTSLIEPAMDLSPFEKYLYAYNIAKKYKLYKENNEDKNKSRNLYDTIYNDYIVCVGFSKLLKDLLNKLGIDSVEYGESVNIGFDNVNNDSFDIPDNLSSEHGDHSRLRVRLVDPKYGIDGIYMTDSTWDNVLSEDSYVFCLMCAEEYDEIYRENYFSKYNSNLLFSATSLEQFYERVNFCLDRKDEDEENAFLNLYDDLMKEIKMLDRAYYEKLYEKYHEQICYGKIKHEKDLAKFKQAFVNFIEEIGEYIVSKVNNKVDGETFRAGITELYSRFYGLTPEEVEQRVNETMEYNKNRYLKAFPIRKQQLKDGTIVDYNPLENKFDISEQKVA